MTDQATFTDPPHAVGRPLPTRQGDAVGAPARYIPALGYPQLTGLYDAFHRWLTPEREIKTTLVQQAAIRRGERVLDVGSGTGTLTLTHEGSRRCDWKVVLSTSAAAARTFAVTAIVRAWPGWCEGHRLYGVRWEGRRCRKRLP